MRNRHLTFKISMMFAGFTLITLVFTSILSYFNQLQIYKKQREESIQHIAKYLEKVIQIDGDDFFYFQKYTIEHFKEIKIPFEFNEETLAEARKNYETLFAAQYPEKKFGESILFDDLSDEIKNAYSVFKYQYYRLLFEQATESFNIAYSYYLVPTGEPEHMYWFLDGYRDRAFEGSPDLLLCDNVRDPVEEHQCMWEAWETGKRPSGYDTYDNEYGKTYAYYSPLFIKGEKMGVIGVEVEIAKVNHAILLATIQQVITISIILIIFVLVLLWLIRKNYIRKLIKLETVIEDYSQNKNPDIARILIKEVTNKDEISIIMEKFADMISELELYMHNLTKTRIDLQKSQRKAIELNEFAIKDSLTGIRNKTGYDKEVQKLEWEISDGLRYFGVAMIDLNFLKRINDTFGHDKGNIAIISLCKLVCHTFEHSPVFRIGGDEFVVILKGHDFEHVDKLIEKFKEKIQERQKNDSLEYWEKTSAAIGFASYDPEIDSAYENVFKRADSEMYKNKKAMKAVRKK